jgi:DNA-binding response OmpR family regulator
MSSPIPILVAIPDEWRLQVCQNFKQQGFSVVEARSQEEVKEIIRQQVELRGIVIVSDWAMTPQNDYTDEIIKLVQGRIPTVTIIAETTRQQSEYRYMDEVFFPPFHEYVTTPFSLDELVARMRKVGMV